MADPRDRCRAGVRRNSSTTRLDLDREGQAVSPPAHASRAIYPLGPLLPGSGLNVTVLSNLGNVDFGFLACPDLVPDHWSIAATLAPTLTELLKAAKG